jgi:hypothetical protein
MTPASHCAHGCARCASAAPNPLPRSRFAGAGLWGEQKPQKHRKHMTPAESSTLAARFLKVKTPEDFEHLQQSLDRLFNNGILTVAEISIRGDKSTTTMILPDEIAQKILQLSKQALIDGVEKAANDFIFEITTAIPDKMLIG